MYSLIIQNIKMTSTLVCQMHLTADLHPNLDLKARPKSGFNTTHKSKANPILALTLTVTRIFVCSHSNS